MLGLFETEFFSNALFVITRKGLLVTSSEGTGATAIGCGLMGLPAIR